VTEYDGWRQFGTPLGWVKRLIRNRDFVVIAAAGAAIVLIGGQWPCWPR